MISENRETRQNALQNGLRNLLYRRYQIEFEMKEIDKNILTIEGALNENETVRRDINTQAAIDQAKAQDPKNGGN